MCYSAVAMYEVIFHLINHSHSHRSLHAVIHFVLILCTRFVVPFTFVIHIYIRHEWNLSFKLKFLIRDMQYANVNGGISF